MSSGSVATCLVVVSPSLLQIGKWCRCLHNVCYLKLKKRRYLDKYRISAPADSTDGGFAVSVTVGQNDKIPVGQNDKIRKLGGLKINFRPGNFRSIGPLKGIFSGWHL